MNHFYPRSNIALHRRDKIPSRNLYFWITGFAFIALATPAIAVTMRGMAGFIVILGLAFMAALFESSFNQSLRAISEGISQNRLLFIFVLWYTVGFILNTFFRGGGLDDWRLMMKPILIILALFYAFAFMPDNQKYRNFQIFLIIVSGIQSLFSLQVLLNTTDIARAMWIETRGAWVYGNQLVFATYAVIFPILMWRSFQESGLLRLLLILSSLVMIITSLVSSFATPLGLVILSAPLILTLSMYLFRRRSWKMVIFLTVIIPIIFQFGYQYFYDDPLFSQASSRIEYFVKDPRSGGYSRTSGGVSRWYLAEISIQTFQEDPLLGKGGPREYNPFIGRHSSFFDSLAIYGLLGGGGAFIGIILLILLNAIRRFWHQHNWETLFALTAVILLTVAGIANPYWEEIIPLVLIMTRPFMQNKNQSYMINTTNSSLTGLLSGNSNKKQF